MRYALLIHSTPGVFEALPADQQQAIFNAFAAVGESPGIVSATRLKGPELATTVRVKDGQTLVTDGPFADTKEVLGGIIFLDADNLDTALGVAAKVPVDRLAGSVEVRPVLATQ